MKVQSSSEVLLSRKHFWSFRVKWCRRIITTKADGDLILKSESSEALRSKLILKDVILGFFIYYNFFTIKAPCYSVISKVLLWSSITGSETGACHRLAAARRHRGSDRLLETGKKASTEIMMTFKSLSSICTLRTHCDVTKSWLHWRGVSGPEFSVGESSFC